MKRFQVKVSRREPEPTTSQRVPLANQASTSARGSAPKRQSLSPLSGR
jgi:hypothetical protein